MRSSASFQSVGPAKCHTVLWPRFRRCRVAAAAPAIWSTVATGIDAFGPAATATTAKSGLTCRSASTPARSGAMTATPSTPWSRSCWMAASTVPRLSERRLETLTAYPASCAACSMPNKVEAGPYSVVSKLTTPSVLERPVTRARAIELGR